MATKRLARTIIEGGRYHWNRWDRRRSNRQFRRREKAYLHHCLWDGTDGEGRCAPRRDKVYRMHFDRLAAARRWLDSHVGRPWAEVRAEMARLFDTRTIAGQHIVFDHLLPAVRGSKYHRRSWRTAFEIDGDGILRRVEPSYRGSLFF